MLNIATLKNETKADKSAFAKSILSASVRLNKQLSPLPHVNPYVMAHYVNTAKGLNGLADLICDILAVAKRPMTCQEIIEKVNSRFRKGTKRYSDASVYTFLCQIMSVTRIVKGQTIPPRVDRFSTVSMEHSNRPVILWTLHNEQ
jgi:hypothetical protein